MLARFDADDTDEHAGGAFVCTTHIENLFLNEIVRIEELIEAEATELTKNVLNGQVSTLKKMLVQMFGEEHTIE